MVGIALSGGGVKGFAHAGFLSVLFKNNIIPEAISGTSAGAIVGALVANGHSPEDILKLRKKLNFASIIRIGNPLDGISSINGLGKPLKRFLEGVRFKDLKIRLYVVATNLKTGKPHIFSKGKVLDAVLASSCVAGLFDPVSIGKKMFIDGGYTMPLPVSAIKEGKIISVTLEHLKPEFKKATLLKTLARSANIMRRQLILQEEKLADLAIRIHTYDFNTFSVSQAGRLFRLGEETAKRHLRKIKKLLK